MDGFPFVFQHVDMDNSYLCGYLKIKGLTEVCVWSRLGHSGGVLQCPHTFRKVEGKNNPGFLLYVHHAPTSLLYSQEYPTLTTFFEGEIISKKHPFLTRKWDADEDVDRKHWVSPLPLISLAWVPLPMGRD